MVRLCERAEFTIMVPKDPNLLTDFVVSIDGEQVANLSSNQEPNSISVNGFEEGSYEYLLLAKYYECYDAATQQYIECDPPVERTKSDRISVQDGARFTIYGANSMNVELRRTR
jgi:hypothetical protein